MKPTIRPKAQGAQEKPATANGKESSHRPVPNGNTSRNHTRKPCQWGSCQHSAAAGASRHPRSFGDTAGLQENHLQHCTLGSGWGSLQSLPSALCDHCPENRSGLQGLADPVCCGGAAPRPCCSSACCCSLQPCGDTRPSAEAGPFPTSHLLATNSQQVAPHKTADGLPSTLSWKPFSSTYSSFLNQRARYCISPAWQLHTGTTTALAP